ncbi:hypothetical protein FHR32_005067 [Streptosporangium album]|uniref:Uncharacterized protein n=1 Tax=Streptosporangium album TaxID=47479 RepID=A0A7W7RYP4_9ACTN|nr:hypothetical protein [Streptosporangium album]MBB4940690.1 hypothetical protein [Streptosporangium album]
MTATVDQAHTIDVLADIASRGLPPVGWHLSAAAVDKLEGQVGPDSDEDKRAAVAAYAALLGVEPTERQHDHHVRLAVTAPYQGVRVTVWAHVAKNTEMLAGDVWRDAAGDRWCVVEVPQPGDVARLYLATDPGDTRTVYTIDGVRATRGPLTLAHRPEAIAAVAS